MKVLHVSGAKSWGGNEQQLLYLVEELEKYEVEQYLFCYENTPLHQKARDFPVKIKTIRKSKPYSTRYAKALSHLIREEKIDLIHLHTSDSVTGFMVTDMFHSLKTPTVFAKKGISSRVSALSKIKYNYRNINRIMCVSNYVKRNFSPYIKKKNLHKLVTVHDGVKVEKFPAAPVFTLREKLEIGEGTYLIGNIANHTKAKDLSTLILMMDHLVNNLSIKDVHLVQIGEFSRLTNELRQLIETRKLKDHITLLGFTENASSFLPQFDVFVISSIREGGPTSLIEALYKKTPVISTRVGIVEDAIVDGENGFSTPVGEPEALAQKIKLLKEDPALAQKFRELSYTTFLNNFTAEVLGKQTLKIYEDVINDYK
ncbi:glycosyltransferase family 4 protein [Antarcticibacterium arcticum]|uniref:Glycosyltransferase family 4 protein n=1 Tax=Antarcticibacterium arcticum TaxID=2585771 RepID=A0A5B8YHH2_9FLAO|nr:glycosyltransferase family 4 protein [Antarcticibacterium arcticum]QED37442.1 glycosyltransferase family 4 protein [Antarcticibacterium arcticum]